MTKFKVATGENMYGEVVQVLIEDQGEAIDPEDYFVPGILNIRLDGEIEVHDPQMILSSDVYETQS